jgi:dipeptidase D
LIYTFVKDCNGKNRSNATKLLGRLLFELRENATFGLADMQGGFKDNVIPREANAEIIIIGAEDKDLQNDYKSITESITKLMTQYQKELSSSEPELKFNIEDLGDGNYNVLHPVAFEKMLFLLVNMPYGVQTMSSDIDGLVESSLNLGIFKLEEENAVFCNSIRSSKGSYKHYLSNRLNYLVSFLGGDYIMRSEYPSWEFKKDSPLREHCNKIYKELYGKDMEVAAIHAGLECGLFKEKMPHLDMISFGPNLYDVHTPDEHLDISSAKRTWDYLLGVLEKMK